MFFRYTFLCKSWIQIFPEASRRNAKTLEVKKIEESKTTVVKSKYTETNHINYLTTAIPIEANNDLNRELIDYQLI